jgi:N-glycosylase/DNA lyase
LQALCQMHGVGRKVADCVALFAIDQPAVVPVDTHVWSIACRDLDHSLKDARSMTPKVHDRVAALFVHR